MIGSETDTYQILRFAVRIDKNGMVETIPVRMPDGLSDDVRVRIAEAIVDMLLPLGGVINQAHGV